MTVTSVAQDRLEVITTSGQEFFNNQINVNWTVGETVISTFANRTHFMTSGFNQTYWEIVGQWDPIPLDLNVEVYPNPISTDLNIRFSSIETFEEQFHLVVYDMLYRPVFEGDLPEEENSFDLSMLRNGTYLIHVVNDDGKFLKTFKVIKNQ